MGPENGLGIILHGDKEQHSSLAFVVIIYK